MKKLLQINSYVFASILITALVLVPAINPSKAGEEYIPGDGPVIGRIVLVEGRADIKHKNREALQNAENNLPLYAGDEIRTDEDARLSFRLKDGSVISLAGNMNISMDRFYYKTKTKNRSSFMTMAKGKARYFIKKLFKMKSSETRIRTQTATIGVRGSDFVIIATEDYTRVATFEKTNVEVYGTVIPCKDEFRKSINDCDIAKTKLKQFEQVLIARGKNPSAPESLLSDDMVILKRELPLPEIDEDFLTQKEGPLYYEDKTKLSPPEPEAENMEIMRSKSSFELSPATMDMPDEIKERKSSVNAMPAPPPPPPVQN